jgi:hypothetical protein
MEFVIQLQKEGRRQRNFRIKTDAVLPVSWASYRQWPVCVQYTRTDIHVHIRCNTVCTLGKLSGALSQLTLSLWNGRQEVRARCSTVYSVWFPSGICYQRFIQGCEGAEELSRQSWQVVYHQLQLK